jgi:PadR family transcriptional regulator PadR
MASRDHLRGTLEVLVLKTLTWGPRHGYAIARWLEDSSSEILRVEEGSLYPALYRMERRGLIKSDRRMSELGRPAKFYQVTAAGRRHLRAEAAEWLRFATEVSRVLQADG